MAGQSFVERFDIFFATATVSAYANAYPEGFRQRDVRFYIELFTNFVSFSSYRSGLPLQNTQISRFLNGLVSEGLARKSDKRSHPAYKLNRVGFIELIRSFVAKQYYENPAHFFFVFSFVENYSSRVFKAIQREGEEFPYAMQLEIESLLDLDALCRRQRDFLEQERKGLEKRISDQVGTRKMTQSLLGDGRPFLNMLREIEKTYPYSMNTKKPMSEFYSIGTERQALWELLEGGVRRNRQQYIPALERIELQLAQIEKLLEEAQRDDKKSPTN